MPKGWDQRDQHISTIFLTGLQAVFLCKFLIIQFLLLITECLFLFLYIHDYSMDFYAISVNYCFCAIGFIVSLLLFLNWCVDNIQLVATTVKNMLLFDMGMCGAFPGIIIPALTGITNEHNRNETLSITSTQASWLGKL